MPCFAQVSEQTTALAPCSFGWPTSRKSLDVSVSFSSSKATSNSSLSTRNLRSVSLFVNEVVWRYGRVSTTRSSHWFASTNAPSSCPTHVWPSAAQARAAWHKACSATVLVMALSVSKAHYAFPANGASHKYARPHHVYGTRPRERWQGKCVLQARAHSAPRQTKRFAFACTAMYNRTCPF